jgi:hypothetical protein
MTEIVPFSLPDGANWVLGNQWIRCEERQAVHDRLTNQDPIEGIAVQIRYAGQVESFFLANRKTRYSMAFAQTDDVIGGGRWQRKPAQRMFDRDFPCGRRAEKNFVGGIAEQLSRSLGELRGTSRDPKERAGVQQ